MCSLSISHQAHTSHLLARAHCGAAVIVDGIVGGERLAAYKAGMLADDVDWATQLGPFASAATFL